MERQGIVHFVGTLVLFLFVLALARAPQRQVGPPPAAGATVTFNQGFIEELGREIDLDDPHAVLHTVFSALDDEVVVYPTENYYYFTIDTAGKAISGNLRLDAADRDRGILHLGYFEYESARGRTGGRAEVGVGWRSSPERITEGSRRRAPDDFGSGDPAMDVARPADTRQQEAAWIGKIAAGSRASFEQLFRAYEQPLFAYFVRLIGDPATAEELTSDVLLQVWKGAGRFRGGSRPSSWIFGIAHHKAMDALRQQKPPDRELEAAAEVADPRPGPEAEQRRGGLRRRLLAALSQLSPAHREVLELTFYHELSYKEIAAIAGCPVNTVKTRMFHAKKQLLPILAAAGIGRVE